MNQIANTDQAEFWSGDPGQAWTSKQPFFDALLEPALSVLFEAAGLQQGDHVVDIGCGTGASLLEAATRVGETGMLTGVDVSTPMLAKAVERVKSAGLKNVQCIEADAQVYDMTPFQADHVISRFGVMFFEEPHAAFANIATAVTPGGQISFVCWAAINENPRIEMPARIAKEVVGTPPPPNPRAPGPMAFADQAYIKEILEAARFKDAEITEIARDLTPKGTCDEVANFAATEGPAMRVVREMNGTEDDIAVIGERLVEAYAQFDTPNGMRVPALFNVVTAKR